MNYSVVIEQLLDHSREVAAASNEAASTLAAVRLDAAQAAMPGGLGAAASGALQDRFTEAGGELTEAITRYADAARSAAEQYQLQEERSAEAIAEFFGQA